MLGVRFDFIMVLRGLFENFAQNFVQTCLGAPGSCSSRKNGPIFFLPRVDAWLLFTSLKACDWSGHIVGASVSPRSLNKKKAMSPSSTVHGGQDDTEVVTFVLLSHEAFVADKSWGFTLERARSNVPGAVFVNRFPPILCESRVFAIDHQFRLS